MFWKVWREEHDQRTKHQTIRVLVARLWIVASIYCLYIDLLYFTINIYYMLTIYGLYIYLLYIQGRLKTYYIYTYMSSPLIVTKSLWEGQSYYRIRR